MIDEKPVQPGSDGSVKTAVVNKPNPEVTPKAERRQFSAEYKLRILAEADGVISRGKVTTCSRA